MSRRRKFIGVDNSFSYLKGRGHSSCVPTSMLRLVACYCVRHSALPLPLEIKKGSSAMAIRAAGASAKLRQSNRTHKRIDFQFQCNYFTFTSRVLVTFGRKIKLFYDAIHVKNQTLQGSNPPKVPQKPNFIVILSAWTWNAN